MPLTIKPLIMKYKDPSSGQYKEITAVTDDVHEAVEEWLGDHVEFTNGFITEEEGIISAHVSEWEEDDSSGEAGNVKFRGFRKNDDTVCVALDSASINNGVLKLYSSVDDSIYVNVNLGTASIASDVSSLSSTVSGLVTEFSGISSDVGDIGDLETTAKTDIVSAINEVLGDASKERILSVTDYGAVGNGIADDSSAIQSALNSGGGIIYFPKGTYKITTAVLFKSNQTLLFGQGATILNGSNDSTMKNLMRTYSSSSYTGYSGVHDCRIIGATFDGGTMTQDMTLVATSHAKNITFENCTFKNAYGGWHDLEINSSYNVKVINCDFEGARKNSSSAELIQIDSAIESSMYPWADVAYDGTVSKFIEISGCFFHDCTISPAIGNHYISTSATNQYIRIHDCVFNRFIGSRGAIDFESHTDDIDIYNNTFVNNPSDSNSIGVRGGNPNGSCYYVYNNRFIGVGHPSDVDDTWIIKHNNVIDGTYTA